MSRVLANVVLSLCFAAAFAAPRVAHAGCTIECKAVRAQEITITPPLPCLVPDGERDDNDCVCSSGQRFTNTCGGSIELVDQDPPAGCVEGCGPKIIAEGDTFRVEVNVPTEARTEGGPYVERTTARFAVTVLDDPQKTAHVIELGAEADIDPEASACSAAPPGLRGNRHAASFCTVGLGLVLAFGLRRRR